MDLKVIEQVQKLTWNFDEVKAELTAHIEKYAGLVVNDENLHDMEKTQKEIAGLRIKLGKFRLAVKKDLDKPYEAFLLQVNELTNLVESAEKPIKDQLQKYEDQRRALKEIEVRQMMAEISAELGLQEKYSNQMVIADQYLNRTQKKKDTKEDIQQRVCWLLEVQNKEIADEAARVEKISMAKMMCEFLSKGLATPLTFEDIENKIESLNIGELRTYIENQVAIRKDREERAAKMAIMRAENERIEQARLAEIYAQQQTEKERQLQQETERQEKIAEAHKTQLSHVAEMAKVEQPAEEVRLYNTQFVLYGVNKDDVSSIKKFFTDCGYNFKFSVKEVV